MSMCFFKKRFVKKLANAGATIIEYALIVSLIAVVAIGGYKAIGSKYMSVYDNISDVL
jgi:Flp pilus assembly pilin Flp